MTTEAKTELSPDAFTEWKARKRKVYDDHVAEVRKRQVSGSENYDKSLVTLASGGLALSLGFLKDFVPIGIANCRWLLYLSWAAFTASTVSTIVSFLLSQRALKESEAIAATYYESDDPNFTGASNKWDRRVNVANIVSGVAFVGALILSTLFIGINLDKAPMRKPDDHAVPDQVERGMTSPTLVKVPLEKGLTSPSLVQVPPPAPMQSPVPAPVQPQDAGKTTNSAGEGRGGSK